MIIKQDAGKLLAHIYDWKIKQNKGYMSNKDILETINWSSNRINNAFDYLYNEKHINAVITMGKYKGVKNFTITAIFSNGIDIVEDESKFKRHFEISGGIPGFLKIKWGVSEK